MPLRPQQQFTNAMKNKRQFLLANIENELPSHTSVTASMKILFHNIAIKIKNCIKSPKKKKMEKKNPNGKHKSQLQRNFYMCCASK